MKVCLDTNVVISGVFWKGASGKILDAWVSNKFSLIVSVPILDEYRAVLRRFDKRMKTKLCSPWIMAIIEKSFLVSYDASQQRQWSRDPDDDKFIHCALAGNAEKIVTGDQDLLVLKGLTPVDIMTPAEFLKTLY